MATTSIKSWKGRREAQELSLPSGNVCLAKRISPQDFIASGVIPDAILPIVLQAIDEKKGLPPLDAKNIMQDREKLSAMLEMMDLVICSAVVEPQIIMEPKNPEDRDPEALYNTDVDLQDKQFIMAWAMGASADLARFRDELDGYVADLSDGSGVENPTVGAAGN